MTMANGHEARAAGQRPQDWRVGNTVDKDVVQAAAKHLHLRGYFGINLAELDEAVRLSIGQGDCDPFALDIPMLCDCYTSKQQIAVDFLKGLFEEARKDALEALGEKLKQSKHPSDVNAVQEVLHRGVNSVLHRFEHFRLLVAGAVAEAFTLRHVDTFLFAETRQIARVYFAGLLGFWRLSNETTDDIYDITKKSSDKDRDIGEEEWAERQYEPEYDAVIQVVRSQLDQPLTPDALVEGLYYVYSAGVLWWLTNRSATPGETLGLLEDLTMVIAASLRKFEAPRSSAKDFLDDSHLRRVLRIQKRLVHVHVGLPLQRLFPRRRVDKARDLLLDFAYGELPKRIKLASGI
jgi:hypothetical protein